MAGHDRFCSTCGAESAPLQPDAPPIAGTQHAPPLRTNPMWTPQQEQGYSDGASAEPPGVREPGWEPRPAVTGTPRTSAPAEVWLVAIGMFAVSAILLDPVVRVIGAALSSVFAHNGVERAFATLVLEAVAAVAACAAALALLAVGLIRGSRVAQLLTSVLAVIVSIVEVAAAQSTPTFGAATSGTQAAVVCMINLAAVALLTLTPGSRAWFAHDGRPLGVDTAAAANVFIGAVCLLDGVLFMLAGAVGSKWVWIGLCLGVVGAALVFSSRALRAGIAWARTLSVIVYATAAILVLVAGAQSHEQAAASTLIPLGIAVTAIAALTVPESSRAYFAGTAPGIRPRSGSTTAVTAVSLAAVLVVALAGVAATHTTDLQTSNLSSGTTLTAPTDQPTGSPSYPPTIASSALSEDDATQTANNALNQFEGTGSVETCDGSAMPQLTIQNYTIDQISEDSPGTSYAILADVTLDDGSTEQVRFVVGEDSSGAGCVRTSTIQQTGQTPAAPSAPAPTLAPAQVTEPGDVPNVPSSNDPVPRDAPLPAAPQSPALVPYTDSHVTPTSAGQIVEWQPSGLSGPQRAAVSDVIGFLTYINQQDFQSAWDLSTEALSASSPSSTFTTGYATSRFYQVAFGQPEQVAAGLIVVPARFVSRQSPAAQGHPYGVTACSYWPQYVFVIAHMHGSWLVDVANKYANRAELAPLKRPGEDGTFLNPIAQRVSC
jgi:hypothetical protein